MATIALLSVMVSGAVATVAVLGLVRVASVLADSDAIRQTMRPDAYALLLIAMFEDRRETTTRLTPLLWMERSTTRSDLAAIAGSFHSQQDLEYRVRRMRAIAGVVAPHHPNATRRRSR